MFPGTRPRGLGVRSVAWNRPTEVDAMTDHIAARTRVSRRAFLRTVGVAGGTVALASTLGRGRALADEVKADPGVKRGGTLRYGILNAPAHFHLHQSGTVANTGPQSPMYDTPVPRHPPAGPTVLPAL